MNQSEAHWDMTASALCRTVRLAWADYATTPKASPVDRAGIGLVSRVMPLRDAIFPLLEADPGLKIFLVERIGHHGVIGYRRPWWDLRAIWRGRDVRLLRYEVVSEATQEESKP